MSAIPPELKAFFEAGGDETDGKNEAAQIWEKGVEGLLSDLELQITKHDTPGEDNVVTRDFTNAFDFIVSGPDDFSIGFYLATLAGLLEQRQKHPDSSAGENAQLRRTRDAIKKWLAGEDPPKSTTPSPSLKEKDHSESEGRTPQRRSTLHKTGVQEIARQLWEEHPDATQQEIADHGSIHQYLLRQYQETNRKEYSIRTVTLWVSEVDPRQGQKKGRPAKT